MAVNVYKKGNAATIDLFRENPESENKKTVLFFFL